MSSNHRGAMGYGSDNVLICRADPSFIKDYPLGFISWILTAIFVILTYWTLRTTVHPFFPIAFGILTVPCGVTAIGFTIIFMIDYVSNHREPRKLAPGSSAPSACLGFTEESLRDEDTLGS